MPPTERGIETLKAQIECANKVKPYVHDCGMIETDLIQTEVKLRNAANIISFMSAKEIENESKHLSEISELKSLLVDAYEALESIASKRDPRHETEEFWRGISHEQCAVVISTDTTIARSFKSKLEAFNKKEVK